MNRHLRWLVAGTCLVFCLGWSACKKQEPPKEAPPVKLSPPETAFPTRPSLPVPAPAEVVGEKGPVRLTLRMLKTQIHKKETSLWVKIIITNIGDSRMLVLDKVFWEGPQRLRHGIDRGLYLEVRDSTGRKRPLFSLEDHLPPQKCWPDDLGAGGEADPAFWLAPGKSTATPAMAYLDLDDAWCGKKPRPKPIGDFGEVPGYYLGPGKYRVRAVFDHSGVGSTRQEMYGEAPDPFHIRVTTPWIELEVIP